MEEVARTVQALADAMKPTEILNAKVAEDVLQAAQRLATVALRSFRGTLLDKALAASRALAELAWEFEERGAGRGQG